MLISLDIFASVFHRILDYKWGWISILAPFLFKSVLDYSEPLLLKKYKNLHFSFPGCMASVLSKSLLSNSILTYCFQGNYSWPTGKCLFRKIIKKNPEPFGSGYICQT
jgi:hypothetical protein